MQEINLQLLKEKVISFLTSGFNFETKEFTVDFRIGGIETYTALYEFNLKEYQRIVQVEIKKDGSFRGKSYWFSSTSTDYFEGNLNENYFSLLK